MEPGATGLIEVTESVGPSFSTGSILNTMLIVMAIALGVLVANAAGEAAVDAVAAMRDG